MYYKKSENHFPTLFLLDIYVSCLFFQLMLMSFVYIGFLFILWLTFKSSTISHSKLLKCGKTHANQAWLIIIIYVIRLGYLCGFMKCHARRFYPLAKLILELWTKNSIAKGSCRSQRWINLFVLEVAKLLWTFSAWCTLLPAQRVLKPFYLHHYYA